MTYITYRLRKGKVKIVLDRNQQYCVSLQEDMCSIQLSFMLHGKDSSAEHRYQLFQYLQSKLELLMNDFMQASTKPNAYVPCYYKDCHKLHVELQLVCNKEYQYCPTEDKPVPDGYYFDLFYDQGLQYNHCLIIYSLCVYFQQQMKLLTRSLLWVCTLSNSLCLAVM